MSDNGQIILCQPDGRKGCSACCGLFNHRDISRTNLSRFLNEGGARINEDFSEDEIISPPCDVRDRTSHICPYQGFLSAGRPGCLLHPKVCGRDCRDRSLFGSRICEGFLCPAHELFPPHAREKLIRYVTDWYLYTLAIIDPDSYLWILDQIISMSGSESPGKNFPGLILSGALEIHARHLEHVEGGIFFYSRQEYSLEKDRFTLSSRKSGRDTERRVIREFIRNSLEREILTS